MLPTLVHSDGIILSLSFFRSVFLCHRFSVVDWCSPFPSSFIARSATSNIIRKGSAGPARSSLKPRPVNLSDFVTLFGYRLLSSPTDI